jgi:hypothetical protein
MARIHDIAVPATISVVFGWVPLPAPDGRGGPAELSIFVQLYDAYGRPVDSVTGGPTEFFVRFASKRESASRRISFSEPKFELSLGLLKSEFFTDRWCVTLDLARLPPDVWSVSFVAFSPEKIHFGAQGPMGQAMVTPGMQRCLHEFKRKFLRIMEPHSKVELELFNVRMQEESDRDDALLLGGLYFAQDLWTFAPVGKKFTCRKGLERDTPSMWNAELAARGPIHG